MAHLLAPMFEFRPGIVARPAHLIEIIHAGPAEKLVRYRKSRRLDDVGGHVHARAKPQNRPRVLGDIGLKKRDLHDVPPFERSGYDIRYRMSEPRGHQQI